MTRSPRSRSRSPRLAPAAAALAAAAAVAVNSGGPPPAFPLRFAAPSVFFFVSAAAAEAARPTTATSTTTAASRAASSSAASAAFASVFGPSSRPEFLSSRRRNPLLPNDVAALRPLRRRRRSDADHSCFHRGRRYRSLPALLLASPSAEDCGEGGGECDVSSLLRDHSLGERLFSLSSSDLAFDGGYIGETATTVVVVAELYESGTWRPAVVSGIRPGKKVGAAPRLEVLPVPDLGDDNGDEGGTGGVVERKTVGVSDVTTLHQVELPPGTAASAEEASRYVAELLVEARSEASGGFPVRHVETCLGRLCDDRTSDRGGAKKGKTKVPSKKQIPKLAKRTSDPSRAEEIMRTALKSNGKLVDSTDAADALYDGDDGNSNSNGATEGGASLRRLLVGAEALSRDAALGGRYKRAPCSFVSAQILRDEAEADEDEKGGGSDVGGIVVLNGGWAALEGQNRAGAEARKFAERTEAGDSKAATKASGNRGAREGPAAGWVPTTSADERIADRLEALAMGDDLADDQKIDVDVREALRALSLPLNPEGARTALLRIGRWSESKQQRGGDDAAGGGRGAGAVIEPWPKEVLDASRSLVDYESDRRETLRVSSKTGGRSGDTSTSAADLEGRVDLTDLPALCVDAPNTSFRDDALGLRTRASTGRPVAEGAGKWEVLVHIADLTDVFAPRSGRDAGDEAEAGGDGYDAEALRRAAERRGYSRYDLPLGPLHLLPPVALKSLSLQASSNGNGGSAVNRCVTLWAYIDQRSGRLLDAGVERTLISAPIGLTYQRASHLLDSDGEGLDQPTKTARGMLTLLERSLGPWSDQRAEADKDGAGRRRQKMEAKEIVARASSGASSFRRTRAHLLVDSALDLYGASVSALLRRADAPVPYAPGRGQSGRSGARAATAPLRRYVDGMAQRQVVAALCGGSYVGPPMTKDECAEVGKAAAGAEQRHRQEGRQRNASGGGGGRRGDERRAALRSLAGHIASLTGAKSRGGAGRATIPAVATGRENEVALLGVPGVSAVCGGVEGTLRTGQRVDVEVWDVDPERGRLSVSLTKRKLP